MDKTKPTICVDLDEVVWDWLRPFVAFMRSRASAYGVDQDKCPNDLRRWTSWDGYINYGYNKEQFTAAYKQFCAEGYFKRLPAIKGVKKNLNKIGEKANVVFVTMRPPDTLMDTYECFRLNGITEWKALVCVGSSLPGKLGSGQTSLWFENGRLTIKRLDITSKKDVFAICKPTFVLDDKPEYIEKAIETEVPHIVIVARLHNGKWRRSNLRYDNMIKGGFIDSFRIRKSNVYLMYPDWAKIKFLMELTNYGKNDYRIEREEGSGQGHSVPNSTEEIKI